MGPTTLSLRVLCLVASVSSSPGAPWTDQETLIVKAKLYSILGEYGHVVVNQYLDLHPELGIDHWPEPESLPETMRQITKYNGVRWIHDYQVSCLSSSLCLRNVYV